MKRTLPILVLGIVLLIAGYSLGQIARNEDASGNNHDLIEVGNVKSIPSILTKFGEGTGNSSNGEWQQTDTAFAENGDLSITTTFQTDGNDGYFVFSSRDASGNAFFELFWIPAEVGANPDAVIRFIYSDGAANVNCQVDLNQDFDDFEPLSVWVKREVGGALTDTVIDIRVFDENGFRQEGRCNRSTEPGAGVFDDFAIHSTDFSANRKGVHELRFFDELVSNSTLNQVTDPTDDSFTQEEVGTEEALYFLEFVPAQNIAEVSSSGLTIDVNKTVDPNFTAHIYALNANLTPIQLNTPPNVTLQKVDGVLDWWNQSSESTENVPVLHQAERTAPGSPVWRISFQNVSPDKWVISAETQVDSEEGSVTNLTISENVEVETMFEIAGMGSSQLVELGIWGGLMLWAMWQGWIFVSLTALMPLFHPIFVSQGIAYPINFIAGVFLFVFAIWARRYADHWDVNVKDFFTR